MQKIEEIDKDSTTSSGGEFSYIMSEDSNQPTKTKCSTYFLFKVQDGFGPYLPCSITHFAVVYTKRETGVDKAKKTRI